MLRTALLAGATGMVGRRCLQRLLDDADYRQVVVLTRRPSGFAHPRLTELQVNFDDLPDINCPARIDDAFCALGTTMRKAGSKEAFQRVDLQYVVHFAELAKALGAKTFVLVSSLGANQKATGFYSQIKGQAEAAVQNLGFETVHLLRPSLLIGEREESRPGEMLGLIVGRALSPLLAGPLRRARPVPAGKVAEVMISAAKTPAPGTHIHYPSE